MSGGAFLDCYDDKERAEKIIEQLRSDWSAKWESESIARLIECYCALRIVNIMTHRADWYISGDDSDESYINRMANELAAVKKDSKIEINNLITYRKAKGWTV